MCSSIVAIAVTTPDCRLYVDLKVSGSAVRILDSVFWGITYLGGEFDAFLLCVLGDFRGEIGILGESLRR